jgi:hypothetical protein
MDFVYIVLTVAFWATLVGLARGYARLLGGTKP